jgi:hypothetical protein
MMLTSIPVFWRESAARIGQCAYQPRSGRIKQTCQSEYFLADEYSPGSELIPYYVPEGITPRTHAPREPSPKGSSSSAPPAPESSRSEAKVPPQSPSRCSPEPSRREGKKLIRSYYSMRIWASCIFGKSLRQDKTMQIASCSSAIYNLHMSFETSIVTNLEVFSSQVTSTTCTLIHSAGHPWARITFIGSVHKPSTFKWVWPQTTGQTNWGHRH